MAISHRDNDSRSCGAQTIVIGQDFVTVNDKLWAVKDDINSHGGGGLIPSRLYVTINDLPIIVVGDLAKIDGQGHFLGGDAAASGDPTVDVQ